MKFTSSHKKNLRSTEERWRRKQIGDLTVAAFAHIGQITVRSTTTCQELCWVLIRSRQDKPQDPPDFRSGAPLSNERNNTNIVRINARF